MPFDTNKSLHGTKVIQAVAIYPNACRYSTPEALAAGEVVSSADYSDTYTGNITVTGGSVSFFAAQFISYIKIGSEIAQCSAIDNSTVLLLERGSFGTTPEPITNGQDLRVIHQGEADGSCRGYPKRPDGKGCSNDDSFDPSVTREFLITDTQLVAGEIYYNGLSSISHSPTILKPGKEIAKNASVSVTINDNTDDDVYSVPYPSVRNSRSTYLRKLHARTGGYLRNRKMIVYSGFTFGNTFDINECISREYIIDDFNISNDDVVTIRGVDPLILTEEAKAKTHDVSAGVLLADIDNSSTQITLKNFAVDEYGADAESGTVLIDSELIDYTVSNSASGILDIVNRGVGGGTQKDHKINASVQKCLVLTDFNPITEIVNILQTRTTIESRFYDDYTAVTATVPNNSGTVYITKPESIKSFINTIIRSWSENNISLYFDELAKKIRIKAVGDFEQQPITLTDVDIKRDSVRIDNKYQDQVTRASIGFAPFDASKKVNDENSSILYQFINLGVELNGTLEPQEDKTFYSKFLTDSDNDVSIAVGGVSRIAGVNTKPPQEYTFTLDYENYGNVTGGKIEEGEIINVETELSIDDDGQPMSQNLQILSIKDDMKNKQVEVKAITYQDIISEQDFDFVIFENKENYVLSDEFAPTEAGEYTIFIASNVTIGATSVNNYAFDTGAQNTGVTLNVIHRGQILGAGGDGAFGPIAEDISGGTSIIADGLNGLSGGDALNITVQTIIDTSQGVIYAGGGGAPSTYSIANGTIQPPELDAGNGGSGGQGYVGGKGRNGGYASSIYLGEPVDEYGVRGVDGSRAAPGILAGISGGSWGSDSDSNEASGEAGQAGFAIRANSNSVTIIGDNEATIRGQRDF